MRAAVDFVQAQIFDDLILRPDIMKQFDRVLIRVKIHQGQLDFGSDMLRIDLSNQCRGIRREGRVVRHAQFECIHQGRMWEWIQPKRRENWLQETEAIHNLNRNLKLTCPADDFRAGCLGYHRVSRDGVNHVCLAFPQFEDFLNNLSIHILKRIKFFIKMIE